MKQPFSLIHFVKGLCEKEGSVAEVGHLRMYKHLGHETELATYHAMQKKTDAVRIIESKTMA
jgi:hypothetical protein